MSKRGDLRYSDELRVYRWALTQGKFSVKQASEDLSISPREVAAGVARLHALGVLAPTDPEVETRGAQSRWQAIGLCAAMAQVSTSELALNRQLAEAAHRREQLEALVNLVPDPTISAHHSVEVIENPSSVEALIEEACARCEREVLTCQPGRRPPHVLERAAARDTTLLRRGVRMRVLYQHTGRHHGPTQEYVEQLTAAGGQVRTLTELFGRMIVFDRDLGIVPYLDTINGVAVIRDRSLVTFLCGSFDLAWNLGLPYLPVSTADGVMDDLKQAILRMLCDGMRDAMIAHRLGMSVRTCRKHIAEIFEVLGAQSRFQAGYRARERSMPGAAGPLVAAPARAPSDAARPRT